MRSFFNFMFGMFSGALVGVAAALLLAPESGDKLRGTIRDRYETALTEIRASVEQERKRLEDELDSLKSGEIRLS